MFSLPDCLQRSQIRLFILIRVHLENLRRKEKNQSQTKLEFKIKACKNFKIFVQKETGGP